MSTFLPTLVARGAQRLSDIDKHISISSVGSLDKMTLQMSISHKSNWHDAVVKGTRRSKFLCALALAMKKVPIYGPGGGGEALGGPTNPTYSVAVSDEWATNSRNKTDADKANGMDKITKSLPHFLTNKMYVTRPGGPKKNTLLQGSSTRLGRDTPEATSSCKLLFPFLPFPAVFFSACDKLVGSRPHLAPLHL